MISVKTEQGDLKYIFLITLAATFGGLLFGYDTAVISGAVDSLSNFFVEPLYKNPETAARVIFQYKICVAAVFLIVVIIISAIIFKLYGKNKGLIISLIMASLTGFFFSSYFGGNGIIFDKETANSIIGFTVSSAIVGCIVGGGLAGYVADKLGRRNGLIFSGILFFLSSIGSALPETFNFFGTESIISFIIYRILGGLGVGLASMLAPMYIAEIAPARIRGKLISWNQFAIIFGMLAVYFVNYYIARQGDETWNTMYGWRYMIGSNCIPSIMFLLLLIFVPESPRFLVLKNREEKAVNLLKRLAGPKEAQQTYNEIKETMVEKSSHWFSYGKPLILIGVLLSVFQQFVGINVVLYYAPEIFKNMGSSSDTALLQTIIVGVINLIFTVFAILTVDKYGRKPMQIIGALGMGISMLVIGSLFYTGSMGSTALFFMFLYVASFAFSWGPITWVLLAEIFPNSIRGAMSIAVAAQWIANLAISWTFPMMDKNTWLTEHFNHGFAFWIYGIMGILAAIFMWKMVPETKGKTLEEIEKIWEK